MRRIYFLALFIILFISSYSQQKYWVTFTDKNQNSFSIDKPEEFLSPKSVERRFRQGIPIVENDLPISDFYINEVKNIAPNIIHASKWLNAISVELKSKEQYDAIKNLPFVKNIRIVNTYKNLDKSIIATKDEPIITIGAPTFDANKYGQGHNQIKMISIDTIHALGYTGKGMDIAVFDAGFINADKLDFFAIARNDERIIPVWNFVDNNNKVFIRSGHGMNVLSVMCANISNTFIGAAPDAKYYLFITEDSYSETIVEEDNWVAAAEKADSIGVDIFNTSLGYTQFDDTSTNHTYGSMNGDSTTITRAANIAASKGILVVNSAGNEGNSSWRYISAPADGDSVFTIGAVNENGLIAGFSSRGPNSSGHLKPNVCGQGANIIVASNTNSVVARSNGTSFSGPLIAASSACLWQAFPNKTSSQIFHEIEKSAHLYTNPNYDYGFGIPNFYKAYKKMELEYNQQNPTTSLPKVYPNPFRNGFTILWNSTSESPLSIRIFNSLGQSISDESIQVPANQFSKIYVNNIADKDAGHYTLQILQDKKSYTYPLIKY